MSGREVLKAMLGYRQEAFAMQRVFLFLWQWQTADWAGARGGFAITKTMAKWAARRALRRRRRPPPKAESAWTPFRSEATHAE